MNSEALIKPYFIENRTKIMIGLLSLIIVDLLQLFIPRIIKRVVDDLTAFRLDGWQLLTYALFMIGIAVFIGIFRYIWRRCLLGTARRIEEGLRNTLFAHLQSLSAAYFDEVKTGDLMAHATNDIQQIRMATGMGMVALNDAVVLGLAAIGFMAYINVTLTAFVLIPMPADRYQHPLFQQKNASPLSDGPGRFFRSHRSDPGALCRYSHYQGPSPQKRRSRQGGSRL